VLEDSDGVQALGSARRRDEVQALEDVWTVMTVASVSLLPGMSWLVFQMRT
jgi:hypothetical protein